MSNVDACVHGVATNAANFHVGRLRQRGIEAEDAMLVGIGRRIELVTYAQVDGELGGHGPLVLRIPGELGPAQGVRIVELRVLGYGYARAVVGETQEHISERVVSVDGAGVAGKASLEHEAAARVADA